MDESLPADARCDSNDRPAARPISSEERGLLLAAVVGLSDAEREILVKRFYEALREASPRSRRHFDNLDPDRQAAKLGESLRVIAALAGNRQALGSEVIRLGIAHRQRMISEEDYRVFTNVLADALAKLPGPVPAARARAFWREELEAVSALMQIVGDV